MKNYDDGKNGKQFEIDIKKILYLQKLISFIQTGKVSKPNEPDIVLNDGTTIEVKSNAGEIRTYSSIEQARKSFENNTITTMKNCKMVIYQFDDGEIFVLPNKKFITALKNANALRFKLKSDKQTACISIKSYMKTEHFNGLTAIKKAMKIEMKNQGALSLYDYIATIK